MIIKIIDTLLKNSNCKELESFIAKFTEIDRIGIIKMGKEENIVTIKGRYYVTDTLECTTRVAMAILTFSTLKGVISWKSDEKRWEV